ncbi:MAG: RluA family pseudouridine synthase [Eubacterium sp.]
MKEYIIDQNSEEQRLDRFLNKLMPTAGKNFLQKMLRKKRIKLNGNRAEPKNIVVAGDKVQIYFSEETLSAFGKEQIAYEIPRTYTYLFKQPVFENDAILVINKPIGLLCQPDASGDLSLVDMAISYLNENTQTQSLTFRPSISNRLDRNTSGIVMIPKDYATLKNVNAAIRERETIKEYHTIVKGILEKPDELRGYLTKDISTNTVFISDEAGPDTKEVHLRYTPLETSSGYTFLNIELFTGRTHQIRSQLSEAGYPIIGDEKYGDPTLNRQMQKTYDLPHQLLHSFHYAIPKLDYDFTAPYPPLFCKLLNALGFKGWS